MLGNEIRIQLMYDTKMYGKEIYPANVELEAMFLPIFPS